MNNVVFAIAIRSIQGLMWVLILTHQEKNVNILIHCKECGAWRFSFDRIWYEEDGMKPEKLYGKWNKKNKEEWED